MRVSVWSLILLGSFLSVGLEAQLDGSNAAILVKGGHYKRAKPLLENRIAANPKDVEALILMARVNLAYDNADEAKRLLQQAISLQSQNIEAHLALAEAYAHNSDDLGMFEKLRVARLVKSETEQALAVDPNNIDALEGMVSFYLQAPGIAGGSTSKANEIADKITALDPVRGSMAKGDIALNSNEGEKAEGLYLKAVAGSPKSYQALMQLISFYMNSKWQKPDKAEKLALQAEQVDGDRVTPYVVLAQIYSSREQWTELDRLLSDAEKHIPDSFLPHYIAGRTLAATGKDNARAERYFRAYLTQDPEGEAPVLAGAHWRLGQVLEKEGRNKEALQELEIAVRMKPELKGRQLREARDDLNRLKRNQS